MARFEGFQVGDEVAYVSHGEREFVRVVGVEVQDDGQTLLHVASLTESSVTYPLAASRVTSALRVIAGEGTCLFFFEDGKLQRPD